MLHDKNRINLDVGDYIYSDRCDLLQIEKVMPLVGQSVPCTRALNGESILVNIGWVGRYCTKINAKGAMYLLLKGVAR
jgi:hypothetical protein